MSSPSDKRCPFCALPAEDRTWSGELVFAFRDRYPVSPGHTLIVPERHVATWFDATREEQRALLDAVNEVKAQLDRELAPRPDGYNVGFNAGEAAGQTVMHLHVHVIPRYRGDMDDPRGGVRHVIPSKGNYLAQPSPLATGADDPFARHILPLLARATDVAIVAAFVQQSGLDRLRPGLEEALRRDATVRLLTGDYLGITQVAALESLVDWMAARTLRDDGDERPPPAGQLAVRVVETASLPTRSRSFHPKSWRFEGPGFGAAFVGSSNLSWAALGSGVEWNLRVDRGAPGYARVTEAFEQLWADATALTETWVEAYARRARERPQPLPPGELLEDAPPALPTPHRAQDEALERLRQARVDHRERALVVFATGLGKTLVSVLDYAQRWDETSRPHPPRLLFLAHRRELLLQAARAFRTLLRERQASATVGWCAESSAELHADLVFASVAKLAREPHLSALAQERFDYVVVDEVHHAAAASYRKILDALGDAFVLGLTATPERADGADVVGLFDDFVAHRAGIGEGIALQRLVPFHYHGVKDTIDYAHIPWRNRRFDPEALTQAAETEARMQTLWRAWEAHPGARTLVFCCSVSHADFVRAWLRARGVDARAIHSGPGADERGETLDALAAGRVDAVCAVDVLNEGVDVPTVDRVIMLRPTESSVVFLQQLGRGLRAADGKDALTVVDFVGNHKVFLERLRHLLSLGSTRAHDLRRLLEDDAPLALPEGCSVDIELEAKELLSRLFRSGGADRVERAYRELADSREERPRAGELHRMGYSLRTLRTRHGSWFDFVRAEGDLSQAEAAALDAAGAFLRDLETTPMTKSFKMVTLQALIEHDALLTGMELSELAARAHRVLRRDPALLADVPGRHQEPGKGWPSYWKKNPVKAWTTAKTKQRAWFRLEQDRFLPVWDAPPESADALSAMVTELVDLRLAEYRGRSAPSTRESFTCKLTWNKRDPILKLPSRKRHDVPKGEVDARLADGSVWVFRFAKEYCNVARPAGAHRNQLPDLLRGWFGPSAGHPGTAFHVRFEAGPDGWSVRPEQHAQVIAFPRRAIPAYADLLAAAGHAPGASQSNEATPVELPLDRPDPALFAVRVTGESMDGGRSPLRHGDWAVFRHARGAPAGSVQGRVALVQVPAASDGHAYQIKRVVRRDDGWHLASDNPAGPDIAADPSMVVIAKLERAFHPESLAPARGARLSEPDLADAFGLEALEPREGRWGGHLFLFVDAPGRLPTPSHVGPGGERPRPGETAFVLARTQDEWRYLGVGRWEEDAARWRIPEVDVDTWKTYGATPGVSRELPPGALEQAAQLVDTLLARPPEDRWIEQAGRRALVTGVAPRGGLRIEGEFEPRTVSLTDLAWVAVARSDVEEHGGRLDEARVNRLRYLEGTRKASTRYIDTGWAIAAWERAEPWLPQRSGVLQVRDDEGTPVDAHFEIERVDGVTSLIFHSRGGTRGSKDERNTEYAKGLEILLARLGAAGFDVVDAFVDSRMTRKLPAEQRRLEGDGISYPLSSDDVLSTRRALGRAMAAVGRKPGAKGGGNQNKQIRLVVDTDLAVHELTRRLDLGDGA